MCLAEIQCGKLHAKCRGVYKFHKGHSLQLFRSNSLHLADVELSGQNVELALVALTLDTIPTAEQCC